MTLASAVTCALNLRQLTLVKHMVRVRRRTLIRDIKRVIEKFLCLFLTHVYLTPSAVAGSRCSSATCRVDVVVRW